MLSASNLRLTYADGASAVHAVDGVSLEVGEREFVGILGPSGSGKSSLLYLLAGLKRATAGEVRFRGAAYGGRGPDDLAGLRRANFGFVFQSAFLVGYLTGHENVAAGGGRDGARLFEELGIGSCGGRFPHQMSAGERQRVSIARAVAHGPAVVFADEPTASLDRASAEVVMRCLRRATAGGTLFVVTHDESILGGATRALRMRAGRLDPA